MKATSTLSMFIALIVMLYLSMGQIGGIYAGLQQAKLAASQSTNKITTLIISDREMSAGKVSFTGKNELLYSGKLYDVVSSEKANDKTIFKVRNDEAEEGLLSDLREIVESWMSGPVKSGNHSHGKSVIATKDYIPCEKFSFVSDCAMELVLSTPVSDPSKTPMIRVLKSPPKFV